MENNPSVAILRALGDEVRLSVVKKLSEDSEPVASCTLVESCASFMALSQPTMSHHLAKLVAAGVLSETKAGTQKYYQLNREQLATAGIDVSKL